jgi:hypothetical protein
VSLSWRREWDLNPRGPQGPQADRSLSFPGLGPQFSWTALYQAQESRPSIAVESRTIFPFGVRTRRPAKNKDEVEWRWVRASRQPLTGEWQCPQPGDATLESAKS